jgi:hypothetical protein
MSQSLSRQDIIGGLAELAKDLVSRGVAADIYIIGGAALVLRYFDRRLTSDVDLRAMDFELIKPSAEAVALRHDWEPDWINNAATQFVPSLGKAVTWETIYATEGVTFNVTSPEVMLVMKLAASRTGRDDADIANLLAVTGFTHVEELEELFEEYFPGDVLPHKALRMIHALLDSGLPAVPPTPDPPRFE